LFDDVSLQPRDLQTSLDAVHGGTRQPQESPAFSRMIGRQRLLDIPGDLRRRVLKLRSHPAIEVQ
jgi:hypothetical protein